MARRSVGKSAPHVASSWGLDFLTTRWKDSQGEPPARARWKLHGSFRTPEVRQHPFYHNYWPFQIQGGENTGPIVWRMSVNFTL